MKFYLETAEVFVPDGLPAAEALARTTHMAVGAHQDDLEIMAFAGILECFQREDKWFTGVVVTNGSGSPRDDLYKDYTDEEMQVVGITGTLSQSEVNDTTRKSALALANARSRLPPKSRDGSK